MKLRIGYCRMSLAVLATSATLLSCNGEIPMVGFDAEGRQFETMAGRGDFESYLTSGLNDLQESAIPALDSAPSGRQWFLRETRVGLGLQGSVGLGDYFKLGGNVGFRLCFANKP